MAPLERLPMDDCLYAEKDGVVELRWLRIKMQNFPPVDFSRDSSSPKGLSCLVVAPFTSKLLEVKQMRDDAAIS